MSQKGTIFLPLLIAILIVGVAVGVYFISQNTSFLSNAGFAKIYIPKRNEVSPTPAPTPALTTPTDDYENPFGEEYENPFNTL